MYVDDIKLPNKDLGDIENMRRCTLLSSNFGLIHEFATSLGYALDAKDSYTRNHSNETADISAILASSLNLDLKEIAMIHIAAHLHDIGKIGIPDEILQKPGTLSEEEWNSIKQHPITGARIVEPISAFNEKGGITDIILHHHERFDGKGYPRGLKGEDIPLGARIVSLADALSAMLSERIYKSSMTFDNAIQEIDTHSKKQFCPIVVKTLFKNISHIRIYFNKNNTDTID